VLKEDEHTEHRRIAGSRHPQPFGFLAPEFLRRIEHRSR
jgi:hypothetical protein